MQEFLSHLVSGNSPAAVVAFVLARSLAIIIPPIPGAFIDLVGIAAFGKFLGFVYGEAGVMLGGVAAFYISRRFREPLVSRFASLRKVHELESNVSERKKFWTLVTVRLLTNSVFDYLSYAAGLTKIGFGKYFVSSLIGTLPAMFSLYYFGGFFFEQGKYFAIAFAGLVIVLPIIFRKSDLMRMIYDLIGLKTKL